MEQLNNNLRKLHSLALKLKYNGDFDADRMRVGDCFALLPVCNYVLLNASPVLAQEIVSLGVELYGVSDGKFVEGFYKVLRDILDYNPKVKLSQFLTSTGFAEKKLSLMADVLQIIYDKYCVRAKPKVVAASRVYSSNSNSTVNGRVEKNLPERAPSKTVSTLRVDRSYPSGLRGVSASAAFAPSINSIDIIDVTAEGNHRSEDRGPAVGSAFHHTGTRPMVESHVQESTALLAPAPFGNQPSNSHYSLYHVEVADQYREAMKLASERHLEMMDKLNGLERKMDRIEGLVHKMESKQTDLELQMRKAQSVSVSSSSACESPSRVIDNLVARTSLIETKLSLLESNTSSYKDDYHIPKTRAYDLPVPPPLTTTHQQTLSGYSANTLLATTNKHLNDSYTSSHNCSKLSKPEYLISNDVGVSSATVASKNDSIQPKEAAQPDYTLQNLSRSFKNIQKEVRLGMGEHAAETAAETSAVAAIDAANLTSASLLATSPNVPSLDVSIKDRSIVVSSSELKEQKARIEALFEETTSALRFPLSNKENVELAATGNTEAS